MNKLSIILCLISLTIASTCCAMGWHEASVNGNLDELQQLIQTEPQNINKLNSSGNIPLHCAADSGKEDAIRILLDHGALAVINQTNNWGSTPLHRAADSGNEDAIRILLERGALAVINQTNNFTSTPLDFAARSGNEDAIKLLQFCQTLKERAPKEMATFLLAFYDRTGSESPAKVLPQNIHIHRLIFEYVKHPSLPLE